MSYVMVADSGGGGSTTELTRRLSTGFTEEEAMSISPDWIMDKETHHEKFNEINSISNQSENYAVSIKEIFDQVCDYGTSFNNKQEILDDLNDALDKMSILKSYLSRTSASNIFEKITRYNDKLDEAKATYWRNRLNEFKEDYNEARSNCWDSYANWAWMQTNEYPPYNEIFHHLYTAGYTYDSGKSNVPACTCTRLHDFDYCETAKANKRVNHGYGMPIDSRPEGT